MLIIESAVVIQIIMAIVSLMQYFKVKKCDEEILYGHGKKSFTDIYSTVPKAIFFNIAIFCIVILLKICIANEEIISNIGFKCLMFVVNLVALAMFSIVAAYILYMITEIKHLSPDDGVGKIILELGDEEELKKAHKFYTVEAIIGLIIETTLLIQAFFLHTFIGIGFVLICIFLYYFGMADVLQHDNYNSERYKYEYKQKSFTDKFFITNIIKFYKNHDYLIKSKKILNENTQNIRKGILYLIKKCKKI